MRLEVSLPYTIYAVPVDDRTLVSLAANQTRRLGYSDNPHRRRLVRKAETQLRRDAGWATLYSLQESTERPPGATQRPFPGRVAVTVEVSLKDPGRRRDADGCWSGLKLALDGIAEALWVDDSVFDLGLVTFTKGEEPETRITLEDA
jgi:hypothetical protein